MKSDDTYLLNLLSNNDVTFFIPPYQRNYEWDKEQCEVFFDDIYATYQSNAAGEKREHFLGTVTFFEENALFGQPAKLVLIDGQQRITTAMLFLAALRDVILDEDAKTFIDSRYLKNNNVKDGSEYKIKLKQVETDWPSYLKIMISSELKDSEKKTAVYRNYAYFKSRLTGLQQGGLELKCLIEKGLSKFSIITIQLETKNSWEEPQEIFESMNSLGKPLSLADLVRNYLMLGLTSEEQTDYYNLFWLHIEETIPAGQASNFIRDYMQAYEHKAFPQAKEGNYKELYRLFKSMFPEPTPKRSVLEQLADYANSYASVLPDGTCGNERIDRLIADINSLKVTTAYSFLMELIHERGNNGFTDGDVIDILDAFRIYCFRRRLIALTAAENKVFPTLGNNFNQLKKATNKEQAMFKILSAQEYNLRIPNDGELEHELSEMNFYNFNYCKLYLSLIEEKLTKSRPDLTDKRLQVEHIMPQELNGEWEKALGNNYSEIHAKYVNTIGNLTLIRHNQELGQKGFLEKKQIYENKAGLQIAKTMITDCDKWGLAQIEARAEWIIGYLLEEVLPIPDSMRHANNYNVEKRGKKKRKFSFKSVGIERGEYINFRDDPTITAKVIGDKKVEFEGKIWSLSPLTKEIMKQKGKLNPSETYQGARYWEYNGTCLLDMAKKANNEDYQES